MSPSTMSFHATFGRMADYSLLRTLRTDPQQDKHVPNQSLRQVTSGHYVEVAPTPLPNAEYLSHSRALMKELGVPDAVAFTDEFAKFFSGDLAGAIASADPSSKLRPLGWATGYALSIMGQEYYQQCPFRNGNGYGDGRAISVLEVLVPDDASSVTAEPGQQRRPNKRWEFQLKGGGRTPYCRGADGRAVLRSSIREFLVSEAMHALGVPTPRALSLFVSKSETVSRPWYSEGSKSFDPDTMVDELVAISTRVAPSFIRVGQIELFGRRARKGEHAAALEELEMIVRHAVEREYPELLPTAGGTKPEIQELALALLGAFGYRLSALVAGWIRVGYCQGNFNSDNCAVGGWTLDYGPFGFIEAFDPMFSPWTGGGEHFAFLNQPTAAAMNFKMLMQAVMPLLATDPKDFKSIPATTLARLNKIQMAFAASINHQVSTMFAAKLGLDCDIMANEEDQELFAELQALLVLTPTDYTLFWRELSKLPSSAATLRPAFYATELYAADPAKVERMWDGWLAKYNARIDAEIAKHKRSGSAASSDDASDRPTLNRATISDAMCRVNPKYVPREWMLVRAYKAAINSGDYSLIHELQRVFERPYDEQDEETASKYYARKPLDMFGLAGTSHCSCSS
jgi:uncharacterized protein YdiU (UPF0061 family)